MTHSYVLNEDQYYNLELVAVVRKAIEEMKPMVGNIFAMFSMNVEGPSYTLLAGTSEPAYTVKQLEKWVYDGDVCDAIEVYHNVHKSIYGIRPRVGTDEQWGSLEWLLAQIKECNEASKSYFNDEETV